MASIASTITSQRLLGNITSSDLKWALGGWCLFIAENALLSENRTFIIDTLGDEGYHILYGTCSTIASASIVYSYRKLWLLKNQALPTVVRAISPFRLGIAGTVMSVGLILASQTAPKIQFPVELVGDKWKNDDNNTTSDVDPAGSLSAAPLSKSWNVRIRCPFDFSDLHKESSEAEASSVTGVERISRHAGLWAFGLAAAGNAALQPTTALALWMLGPALTAWLGGSHTDSRYRRGLGGTLDASYDAQTSNIPFAAMLTGKQTPGGLQTWLSEELKATNAVVAIAVACTWVASRGRASRRIAR
jgi:hypothetical protein